MTMSLSLRIRVAYNLRRVRLAGGLTQPQAAAAFGNGMRGTTISRYENAHVRPSEAKLLRFAEIYNVDIGEFYAPMPEDWGKQ